MSESSSSSEIEQKKESTARTIRHIGYAVFGTIALLIAITLGYVTISGHYHHQFFDPFTGDPVQLESPDNP